jgi:hypothetical protein
VAGKNKVTLTLAGDAKSLERAFDRAGTDAKAMAEEFEDAGKRSRRAAEGIERAGDKAGDTEGKFTGLADVMDGLNTAFGLGLDRQIEYARAGGDVLGGLEQLKGVASGAVDAAGKIADKYRDMSVAAVKAQVATVRAHATQAVAWVKSSAQAMANAVRIRAAWLISMGPIALVVAAVAGAVYLIVKYWDEIRGAAEATWQWVSDKFSDLAEFFTQWAPLLAGPVGLVLKYWDDLKAGATGAWEWITGKFNALVSFMGEIPGRIGRNLTGPFEGIKGGAETAREVVSGKFNDLVTFLSEIPGRIGRNLTGAFSGILEAAGTVWSRVSGVFDDVVSAASGIKGRITSAVSGAFDAIGNALRSAWNWIAGKLNAVQIPSVKILGRTITPAVDPIPHVPTMHTGGVVPGPRGSLQAIMALGGERVLPPAQSAAAPVTINVHALDPRSAASAVFQALEEYQRRNGPVYARF